MRLALKAGALVGLALAFRDRQIRAVVGDVLIVVGSRLAPFPLLPDDVATMTEEEIVAGEERLLADIRVDRRINARPLGVLLPGRHND